MGRCPVRCKRGNQSHRIGQDLELTCPFGVMLFTWVQAHKHVSLADGVLAVGRAKTLKICLNVSMYPRTKDTCDNLADTTFTDRPNNGKHMQISLSTTFIMIPSQRRCHTVPQREGGREIERRKTFVLLSLQLLNLCNFSLFSSALSPSS